MAEHQDSGIYEIVNLVNGKRYVGSAVNCRQRWYGHTSLLNKGTHHSIHLQRAWNKHGVDSFEFRVLETVLSKDDLLRREQWHIDALRPEYNIAPRAGSSLGVKHSEEVRIKVGDASRRAWQDEEVRAKLMAARKDAWLDSDRRARGVAAARAKWEDPEFRTKVSASHAKREVTDEFKAAVKAGIANRKAKGLPFGRQINPCFGRPLSEETKEKLRQANLGKIASDETRRKMSESRTGKRGAKRSEEAKANMRAAWARRKAAAPN